MIELRPKGDLGTHRSDWLESYFHFSFAEYRDPRRMGFGRLRVWNDDTIQPTTGFAMHGHRDMEIISYVRRGAIAHEDSLGNKGRTRAGNVQVMSAGTGIRHSEFNLEDDVSTLFQIWIEPSRMNVEPRWETREFPTGTGGDGLAVMASGRSGDDGVMRIHQDAALLCATVAAGDSVAHAFAADRCGYMVPARGSLTVNGVDVAARDGVAIWGEDRIVIEAREESEVVLVDLPPADPAR